MTSVNIEKVKKIGEVVLNVLVWIILIMSIITTVLVFTAQADKEDGIPAVFGNSLITIQTESMEPTFKKGSLVFMTKLDDNDKANLIVGDIITFRVDLDGDGEEELNTHRIDQVLEEKNEVITKGDAYDYTDNEGSNPYTVHFGDIIGMCKEKPSIPGVGAVLDFLRSSLGFFLCIVLPLILFFLYQLYNFISILVSERAKKAPVSKETEEEIRRKAIEEYLKAQAEKENKSENEDKKPEPAIDLLHVKGVTDVEDSEEASASAEPEAAPEEPKEEKIASVDLLNIKGVTDTEAPTSEEPAELAEQTTQEPAEEEEATPEEPKEEKIASIDLLHMKGVTDTETSEKTSEASDGEPEKENKIEDQNEEDALPEEEGK